MLLNPDYSPDTYSIANGQIMADFAVTRGKLTREEASAWLADLHQLGSQGRYFFSLNRYLFLATGSQRATQQPAPSCKRLSWREPRSPTTRGR